MLKKGTDNETVSENNRQLIYGGYNQRQAVSIAINEKRLSKRERNS